MIHPHIPRDPPTLSVRQGPHNLIATIAHDGATYSFPLPRGHAERALENALLHIASGLSATRITEHFIMHTQAESSCPCCKLEGRILSGMGRKTVRSEDLFRAARSHHGGKTEIRHLPAGLSGAQILELNRKRAAKRPTVEPVKFVSTPIEELI
jgi:hypothetical protein